MANINIHTVLGCAPRQRKHEILVIMRGATASLNFNLHDKVYNIEHIDQFTYSFKQGKNLYAYDMLEYFMLTEDTVVKADKNYYERYDANASENSLYKFVVKTGLVVGSTIPANTYYEEYYLPDGESTDNWQFNSHYTYVRGTEYSYINFILSSEETKQFSITAPDCNVQCEAAIRLNTDAYSGMHNTDSIIIEPLHPIAVVDSLYSKISQAQSSTAQSVYASESTYCSETLTCRD